jgi:protein TonB
MVSLRPAWSTGASLAIHGAALAAAIWWLAPFSVTPPPTLPQIEFLPPLPVPSTPQEAQPTPVEILRQSTPAPAPAAAPKPIEAPPEPQVAKILPEPDKTIPPDLTPKPASPVETPVETNAAPAPTPDVPPVISTVSPVAEIELPKPPLPKPRPKHRPLHAAPRAAAAKNPDLSKTLPAAASVDGRKSEKQVVVAEAAAPQRPAGPPPDYIGLIRARLENAKRYPLEARSHDEQGTPLVDFVLDRSGRLLSSRLQSSSGVSTLDAEAIAMVGRAAPFPPFPPSMVRDRLELVVPIQFMLK